MSPALAQTEDTSAAATASTAPSAAPLMTPLTTREVIEKANTLLLQKDRTSAINLLVMTIRKEPKRTPNKDLLTQLDNVTNAFLSEKAQQLFELAISLKYTDPNLAGAKLAEAGKIEPDNFTIAVEQARMQITLNDCSGAAKSAERMLELDPYQDAAHLVQQQSKLCQGHLAELDSFKASDAKKSKLYPFLAQIEIEKLFKNGHLQEAAELARDLEAHPGTVKNYPEATYWRWKIADQLQERDDKSAQKYLDDCRKISSRQQRDLAADPNLCRRTAEVENFLKKSHTAD